MYLLSCVDSRFIKGAGDRYFFGFGAISLIVRDPKLRVPQKESILSASV